LINIIDWLKRFAISLLKQCIGEAFPKYNEFPGTRLLIDVESVETRVESKSPRD